MENDPILSNLTDVQHNAVVHPDGPLLIFAGAGSGKTRVLTHRIAYLIDHHNVDPDRILAVTFTNKAAHEMRARVDTLLPGRGHWVWVSTFHAACVRILRRDGDRIGYAPNFVIYDDADQMTLIKQVLRELSIDDEALSPRSILSKIDKAKCTPRDPAEFTQHVPEFLHQKYITACARYAQELKRNNAFDFGDLIVKAIELLETVPPVREYYRQRLLHVLVDEFQDTNTAQYRLLTQLLGDHMNICVVGDDDQSIYRWRGAEIDNILGFEKDFPGAQVVILGENFRSTKTILEAAANVIDGNVGRQPKELFTHNPIGELITLYRGEDEYAEARFVAEKIDELTRRKGMPRKQIAVFYRTNAQSRVFEEEFARNAIPCQVIGGTRFYDRKEIKDVLAYLRVVINPADSISLRRIINVPARGIGKTTLERIGAIALEREMTFLEGARAAVSEELLLRGADSKVKSFLDILDSLVEDSGTAGPAQMVQYALDRSGYLTMLDRYKSIEAMTRRENLAELTEAVSEFEKEYPDGDLTTYLEQVALISDPDMIDDSDDAVQLMTIHSAKGLEFPTVFIVGLEEGLFPHSRSINNPPEMAEERRLCYVALTRAKKRLFLTSAEKRRSYAGLPSFTIASRFLDDVPASLIEVESPFAPAAFKRLSQPGIPGEPTVDYSYSQEAGPPSYEVGMFVRHAKFGKGRVVFIEGEGEYATAIIQFDRTGIKKLRLAYAKLVPI